MKAMILAAGLGKRMRPLTDRIPKPLLPLGQSTLIETHLDNLAKAGIKEVVINISYLAEKIEQHLGSGERYGLHISYSREEQPLETAGGIKQALPLLGDSPFILVNGDVWSDFPLERLAIAARDLGADSQKNLAHMILVENPEQHPEGDFSLDDENKVCEKYGGATFTYSGMIALSPKIFDGKLISNRLADVLVPLMSQKRVSAEVYEGKWVDVGTPERLAQLRNML